MNVNHPKTKALTKMILKIHPQKEKDGPLISSSPVKQPHIDLCKHIKRKYKAIIVLEIAIQIKAT